MNNRRTIVPRPGALLLSLLASVALLASQESLTAATPTFHDDFTDMDATESRENVALLRQCPPIPQKPAVRVDKGEQGQHPFAIKLANGELLCAFFRVPTKDPHATVRRSSDNGRTWSDPALPIPKPNGMYSRLIRMPNGRVWLGGSWDEWSGEHYAVYSDDNGHTWTKVLVPRTATTAHLLLSNGDFLWMTGAGPPDAEVRKTLPATRNFRGINAQRGLCLFEGVEDGKVKLSEPLVYPQLGNPDEWDVVETAIPGRLVAILRQQETGDHYYMGISKDYGRTFESRPTPIWYSATPQKPAISRLDNGTLVLAYGERDNSCRMMAIASFDHGETWETHRKLPICDWLDYDHLDLEFLYSPKNRVEMDLDHGYASLCQLSANELMGLWAAVHFPGEVYATFLDSRFFKDVHGGISLSHTGLPLDQRCIARWSFDEEKGSIAEDPARYNYGHIIGPRRVPGRFGTGLRFDGQDDFVMVPDSDVLRVPTLFTLEAWINTDDSSRHQTILDKSFGESVKFVPYLLELKNGRLLFQTGSSSFRGERTLESHQWTHVAVRVWPAGQRTHVSFHVNGERDGDAHTLQDMRGPDGYLNALRRQDRRHTGLSYTAPRDVRVHALTIGLRKDYATAPFAGMIDEVAIHADALTEDEIRRNATRRHSSYGQITSRAIQLKDGESWGNFDADFTAPEGSSIHFTILDLDIPELPRKVMPGSDLSSLSAKTINLCAELRSETGSQTPVLKSWGMK